MVMGARQNSFLSAVNLVFLLRGLRPSSKYYWISMMLNGTGSCSECERLLNLRALMRKLAELRSMGLTMELCIAALHSVSLVSIVGRRGN